MSEALLEQTPVVEAPDISQLVTQDDTPVDNIISEKQQRLLVEPLYISWNTDQPFIAVANVGVCEHWALSRIRRRMDNILLMQRIIVQEFSAEEMRRRLKLPE